MSSFPLARVAAYVRRNAQTGREIERTGPFVVTVTPGVTNPYLNYALVDDGASPGTDEVVNLVAAFVRHDRRARLEWFPALAPDVEEALLRGGFSVEGRLPLLGCEPDDLLRVDMAGIELVAPGTDDEFLAVASVQHLAYGEPEPAGPDDAAGLRRLAERGGAVALAVDGATGAAIGGGVCDVVSDGLGEVAGIGVHPDWRGRHVAGALAGALARSAFDLGAELVFLTAGPEARPGVYERAGYRLRGEQEHASVPPHKGGDHRSTRVVGNETETLLTALAYLRQCVIAKVEGVSEAEARRPLVASGTNLLGVLKHVCAVEAFWVLHVFAGLPHEDLPHEELEASDTVGGVVATYRAVAARTSAVITACPDLATRAAAPSSAPAPTLRWILTHLIEEIARHAGHMDILREQIDGAVGR